MWSMLGDRPRRGLGFLVVLVAGAGAVVGGALLPVHASQASASGARTAAPAASPSPPAGGLRPGTKLTPLAASVISRPAPVKGTDGRYHLAYELLLTNLAPRRTHIARIEVTDARTHRVLLRLAGKALVADMNPIGGPPARAGGHHHGQFRGMGGVARRPRARPGGCARVPGSARRRVHPGRAGGQGLPVR